MTADSWTSDYFFHRDSKDITWKWPTNHVGMTDLEYSRGIASLTLAPYTLPWHIRLLVADN